MYFESHAHYDDEKFDADRYELIEEMHKNGVDYIINVGSDIDSSEKSLALSQKYDFIYAAVGIHPHEADKMQDSDMDRLAEMCRNSKTVAIGEIGLDFYYDFSPRDIQKQCFAKQLKFCENVTKPVIIHSRDAAQECFDMIKASRVRNGVIHAYSGSVEMAREYIKLGFYIGVGGIITFKNSKKLVEVVSDIPMERILIETDSPYLAPEPVRGRRNNSQNLEYIADKIAQIKQITVEKVAEISRKNAFSIFDIK